MRNLDRVKRDGSTSVTNGADEDARFEPLRLLSTRELGVLLGMKVQSIRALRARCGGPRYIRIGGPRGKAAYDLSEIKKWLSSRTYESTSAESAARLEEKTPSGTTSTSKRESQ